MVTFTDKGDTVIVKLDGRITGAIKPSTGGYRYYPAKSSMSGDWYGTINEVKQSLIE